MRAVVMEILKNDYIIVLTKDGQFKKVKYTHQPVEVGMEIDIQENKYSHFRRIAAVIALVILIGTFGGVSYAYYTPYGFVNVEVNPSIEIIYNRFNRVLSVNGINDEGQQIISELESLKHKPVNQVVSHVIQKEVDFYSETHESANVLITYDGTFNEENIDTIVNEAVAVNNNVNIYTNESEKKEYDVIKQTTESPGKALLIEKLSDSLEELDQIDDQKENLGQIIRAVKELEKNEKKAERKNEKNNGKKNIEQNKDDQEYDEEENDERENQNNNNNESEEDKNNGKKNGSKNNKNTQVTDNTEKDNKDDIDDDESELEEDKKESKKNGKDKKAEKDEQEDEDDSEDEEGDDDEDDDEEDDDEEDEDEDDDENDKDKSNSKGKKSKKNR